MIAGRDPRLPGWIMRFLAAGWSREEIERLFDLDTPKPKTGASR